MANVKISDLTSAAAATGTQQFEVNDGFVSKKVTGAQILSYIEGEISSSPVLTGQVSLDDGTATAPSLTNTGDTNTGVFFPAADTISIATGGTERVTIDSSGRVGIGVTSLSERFQVAGAIITSAGTTSNKTSAASFDFAPGINTARIYAWGSSGTTANIAFLTGSGGLAASERMRIDSSGNVGIGTTSPDAKFQVSGTSGSVQLKAGTDTNGYLEVNAFDSNPVYCVVAGSNATAGVFGTQTNIPTIFYSNNTERFRIGTSGQLGIGGANYGTSGQVLVSGGSSAAPSWGSVVTQGTSQTFAAAGNSFTGIPSTAKIIIIAISSVNPTGDCLVRLGTSSGFVSSSYSSTGSWFWKDSGGGGNGDTANETTGFLVNTNGETASGTIKLTNVTGNTWVCDHTVGASGGPYTFFGGGTLTLSGTLDRVQFIPSSGSFATSGSVNIIYY